MVLNRMRIACTVFNSDENHTANPFGRPMPTVFVLFFYYTHY